MAIAPEAWQGAMWRVLHQRPANYTPPDDTEWLASFMVWLPCNECRGHWAEVLVEFPPDTATPERYFAWTVQAHNVINRKLGKRELSLAEATAIWKPFKPYELAMQKPGKDSKVC